MTVDLILNVIVGAIVPFLMAFVGIWLSLETLQSRRHKIISVAAFVCLFCVGVFAVGWQQWRGDRAQRQRDNSITSLNSQLNIMTQWVLHPAMESELRELLGTARQMSGRVPVPKTTERHVPPVPSPSQSQRLSVPQAPSAPVAEAETKADEELGKLTNHQLKVRVAAFAEKLREFEAAFQLKDQEIALNQPLMRDSGDADLDHALQQLTIQRLQRTSDYEAKFRKEYLPEALRLQAELIRRTPPTQFPDLAPMALKFGGANGGFAMPGSNFTFLGSRALGEAADYLERLAHKLQD